MLRIFFFPGLDYSIFFFSLRGSDVSSSRPPPVYDVTTTASKPPIPSMIHRTRTPRRQQYETVNISSPSTRDARRTFCFVFLSLSSTLQQSSVYTRCHCFLEAVTDARKTNRTPTGSNIVKTTFGGRLRQTLRRRPAQILNVQQYRTEWFSDLSCDRDICLCAKIAVSAYRLQPVVEFVRLDVQPSRFGT